MNELTLSGLLRMAGSDYVKEDANYLIVEIQIPGNKRNECIINPKDNFSNKINYYKRAYNEDLTLKSYPKIRIACYDFVEKLADYFE